MCTPSMVETNDNLNEVFPDECNIINVLINENKSGLEGGPIMVLVLLYITNG